MATTTKKTPAKTAARKPASPKAKTTKPAKATPRKSTKVDAPQVTTPDDIAAEIAKEAPGLVAQDDIGSTSGFVPVGLTGVTRPMPATGDETPGKFVKKDLIDRVIARSGAKPRHVRQVVEAMLVELGTMLDEAEMMQIQPLGSLKVQRRKDVDDGQVIICKLKRKKSDREGNDPLAAAAE